jgi:large subunit ribosomal protein L3
MSTTRAPRHGSLQYVPHKRAKRTFARVRSWATIKDAKPVGFAGFKAGMTHVMILDTKKTSPTKGREVSTPVTVIECPPLKIMGLRTYTKDAYGIHAQKDYIGKTDKRLANRVGTKEVAFPETISCAHATLLVHTQPGLTTTGQKTPHIFELNMGGKPEDVLAFVKAHKEIRVSDVFKAGTYVDIHSITKGLGFTGVVKKHGVGIRRHKSEKVKRGAVMGPEGYAKVTFEAPMPGKLGHHTRTEWNKKLVAVTQFSPENDVTPSGGFLRYGNVKNDYVLLKGSTPGLKHTLIRFNVAIRKDPKATEDAPAIEHVSRISQQ